MSKLRGAFNLDHFPNSKCGWDRWFSVPWAFKLDHLHPFKPLLFWKIFTFFTFILGSQFLLPREPIMGKGNSSYPKSGWDRGFSVPGASKLDHLHPFKPFLFWKFSNFFTFILGGQFLLPQRVNNGKREFIQLQNWIRQRVSSAWSIQTGPFEGH